MGRRMRKAQRSKARIYRPQMMAISALGLCAAAGAIAALITMAPPQAPVIPSISMPMPMPTVSAAPLKAASHGQRVASARSLPPLIVPPPMQRRAAPIAPNSLPVAKMPARPGPPTGPAIAIVIDDLGLSMSRVGKVLELPERLTLAFLPYGGASVEAARLARARGHELLLHLPMEPLSADHDPGKNALLARLGERYFHDRLGWNLARFDGYVGINNHMGSRLTRSAVHMTWLARALKQRGLFFLDSSTVLDSQAERVIGRLGVPALARDIFLDDVVAFDAVMGQLGATEALARRRGEAIAIGHPHAATIEALRQWLPAAKSRGLRFVTLREILEMRQRAPGSAAHPAAVAGAKPG